MSNSGTASGSTRRELRASDLARLLEQQIQAGEYAAGDRLPTVRDLAERYRVNKNTAARAYRRLEEHGLIVMARGRGAFVRDRSVDDRDSWYRRARDLIRDAHRLGLSRRHILDHLVGSIDRTYEPGPPRLLFVECNRQDLETLGDELSRTINMPMEQMLLDDALQAAHTLADRFDLIVTSFQHLGQLQQATGLTADEQIVGVLAHPSHDSLLELARLHVDTFGLVCDTPATFESLSHIIGTYNPGATVLPTLIDDTARLAVIADQADAIVVTRSCRRQLETLGLAQPIVTVVFAIDQQSIDFLQRRLQALAVPVDRNGLDADVAASPTGAHLL
jgi:GntR family transcriptional regulator